MKYDSVYPTFRLARQARSRLGGKVRRKHLAAMPDLWMRFDHSARTSPQAGARCIQRLDRDSARSLPWLREDLPALYGLESMGRSRTTRKTQIRTYGPRGFLVCELVRRLPFFRSLDPLPVDGRLLARSRTKEALVRQLRDYLHQVCHALGLPTRIVPHQFRHSYASEMLRAGVGFPVLMKLLGHTSPEMTMRSLDVALTDLQREFQLARSKPRHLAPQPRTPFTPRAGLDGLRRSAERAETPIWMLLILQHLARDAIFANHSPPRRVDRF